jgi:serine/threonine-protein kinase
MSATVQLLANAVRERYTLERELGRGGMATVFLAEDRKHGRKVAIKVLHPELSAILGTDRFLAEIKLTASLQHPHILGLIDSGSVEGQLYYVMPYVSGESVRQRLLREKQLPVPETVRLAAEVADALDYAHARGVVHRDIKPENILLQGDHAFVADFGIAIALQEAGGSRMTQTGLSLGTPQYMSPEQAAGDRALTGRSDIYAIGAVTYELLTGEPPFTAATPQGVIAKVMTETPTPPSRYRKSVPPHVDWAVLTALEKVPADRFATAAEFAKALTTASVPLPATTRRRSPGPAILPLAATAILALAAGYVVARLDRSALDVPATGGLRRLSLELPDSAPLAVGTGRPAIALTPDGSRLVYVARVHGEHVVMVRDLRTDSLRALPGSVGGTGPVVSPSGSVAGFFVGWNFFASGLAAGRSRRLESITPVTRGAVWLSDSTAGVATDPNGHVIQVPFRQPLHPSNFDYVSGNTTKSPEIGHAWPELLPGGSAVLYVISDPSDPVNWRIAARVLPDGEERILIDGGSNPRYVSSGHLVFVREGGLWAVEFDPERLAIHGTPTLVQPGVLTEPDGFAHYAISASGTLIYARGGGWQPSRRLAWVSPDGAVDPLPLADGMYESVALAPDGRRAAVVRVDGTNHDIWVGDLARGTLSPVTRHGGEDGAPVWSPNGRHMALATEQWNGPPKLAISELGGGLRLAVDTGFRFSAPTDWSEDGRRVYLNVNATGLGPNPTGSDIFVLDGTNERVWLQTPGQEGQAVESGDGRWVAYVSDESGRDEVYVRRASGVGAAVLVSVAGGTDPHWGRASRRLYYRRGDRVFVVDVIGTGADAPDLSTPRLLVQLPPGFLTASGFSGPVWDLALDERRVLGVEDRKHLTVGDLHVVLDWPVALRAALSRGGRE